MNIKSIFSNSVKLTEKTLDFLWQRQGIISDNIANQDTPNYKARVLRFEDSIRTQLESAGEEGTITQYDEAISRVRATIDENNTGSNRADGNNVSPDAEYAELARTGLQYQSALRAINDELMRLRSAIKGQ